jgi:DNA-binding NtrC family response regulator
VDPALALALFTERPPPQLVIADYRLQGGENGSDAIQRLSSSFGITLPGIILTGDTSPERIREASRSDFILLHKPVNPRDLLAGIRRALANGGVASPDGAVR